MIHEMANAEKSFSKGLEAIPPSIAGFGAPLPGKGQRDKQLLPGYL